MYKWLFFLYFYSFLGWCFESVYVSVKTKQWVNRGFMRGPFLPIYGTGAVMMLLVSKPFQDNLLLTYLAGCVGATLLEYVTGTVTEALFKVRYWDYTGKFMNFQGQICLTSTIAWGFFTIMMTELLHGRTELLVAMMPEHLLKLLTFVLTIFISVDYSLSFKAALDIRDVLIRLEAAKEEMERLQKRLDVLIAVADQALVDEREELRLKFHILHDRRMQLKSLKDSYKRRLLLGNPGMISRRFKGAVEELRESAKDYVRERRKRG